MFADFNNNFKKILANLTTTLYKVIRISAQKKGGNRMCDYIGNAYLSVFGKHFAYRAGLNERMQMQKMVYLLERMGMNVGDYNFVWYKHGPYSQGLQDDASKIKASTMRDVKFTEHAQIIMNKMKTIAEMYTQTTYDMPSWLEAVASLDFLLTRKMYDEQKALNKLKELKPHLNDNQANIIALSVCQKMCA